jgi:hypothetical protein
VDVVQDENQMLNALGKGLSKCVDDPDGFWRQRGDHRGAIIHRVRKLTVH